MDYIYRFILLITLFIIFSITLIWTYKSISILIKKYAKFTEHKFIFKFFLPSIILLLLSSYRLINASRIYKSMVSYTHLECVSSGNLVRDLENIFTHSQVTLVSIDNLEYVVKFNVFNLNQNYYEIINYTILTQKYNHFMVHQ